MYLIGKDIELTQEFLGKVLQQFQTRELPKLNRWNKYYAGNQKILQKTPSDTGKPCNKIVVNYCYNIVNNYLGYISGIPITYENDNFKEVLDILKYNDVHQEDSELLRQALINGRAFEIAYIDEDGKQRFRLFDSRNCVPIYEDTLTNELKYVVRFYREELLERQTEKYIIEVYGPNSIKTYRSGPGFVAIELIDETPHFFGQCPVTVFSLNKDEESIFNQVMSLQDAYNELLSDEVDDFDAFADAYLLLKGVIAGSDELEAMKKNRVLMVDTDASAEYLTKSISDTQIQNMLQNVNDQIHKIANSPDFNDEKFMAQSGIAMKYKLVGFENAASDIESYMRKALQRRIELITTINNIKGDDMNEQAWRDVEITFTRNLPQSLEPTNPTELMAYKGLVSDETLLAQIPFVKDVKEEMKLVKKQQEENMSLFNIRGTDEQLLEEPQATE